MAAARRVSVGGSGELYIEAQLKRALIYYNRYHKSTNYFTWDNCEVNVCFRLLSRND